MHARTLAVIVIIVCVSLAGHAASARATTTTSAAWCSGSQSWKSVRGSIGDLIRVKASVSSVTFARSSAGRPTFIDLGMSFPSLRRVTLVIWEENRSNFPRPPERMFRRGTLICVQGVPRLYRGVPQIEVALWDAESRLLSF